MITSFFKPKESKTSATTEKGNQVNLTTSNGIKRPRSDSLSTKDDKGTKHAKVTPDRTGNFTDLSDQSSIVNDLLKHLTEESWRSALTSHLSSSSFYTLAKFVASERASKTVYPPQCDTFSALNLVPLHKVKVVIVGQDPYHQPNQGHGLAFSVRKGQKIPPSLGNIYKELMNDNNIPNKPGHGYLERWARQGVLMLNAVLTVRRNEPNSHAKKGWEQFTDEVIRVLLSSHGNGKLGESRGTGGIVFLLWGKPAGKKAESIVNQVMGSSIAGKAKSKNPHVIICTSHPSPLGASKTNRPFLGSKCFSRANKHLIRMSLDPVDWCVDDPLEKKMENTNPYKRAGCVEVSDV